MTRFEEALLQDVLTRLGRMSQESRLSMVNAVGAACAGSEQAQELIERRVSATVYSIRDNILDTVKDCLKYHHIGELILCLIRDEFDEVSVAKMTDAIIEELGQSDLA